MKSSMKNQGGFTLTELIVVVVILGIMGAVAGSSLLGQTDSSKAQAKMALANAAKDKAQALFRIIGTGNSVTSNPLVASNNTLEDVLFTNKGVASTYQDRFDNAATTTFIDALNVQSEPVDGSSAGTYFMPDTNSEVSIVSAGTNEIGFRYTNSTSKEVETLVNKYDQSTAFSAGSADNSGAIQYSADGGSGLHTLTIVRSL